MIKKKRIYKKEERLRRGKLWEGKKKEKQKIGEKAREKGRAV